MDISLFQIFIAIVMSGVALTLYLTIRRYMVAASERRMISMTDRLGLDPAFAASGDTKAVMKEVRRRCRSCPSEALCERWLAGKEDGDNGFCPNAEVFSALKRTRAAPGIL